MGTNTREIQVIEPSSAVRDTLSGAVESAVSAVKRYLILQRDREAAVSPVSLSVSEQNSLNAVSQMRDRPRSSEPV